MTRIDLPGGHWVELRDPMEVTAREAKRAVKGAIEAGLIAGTDLAISVLVANWSLEAPLGDGFDRAMDMPAPAYAVLEKDPLVNEGLIALFPEFGPSPEPDSPSAASGS